MRRVREYFCVPLGHMVILLLTVYIAAMAILWNRSRKYTNSFETGLAGGDTVSMLLVTGMAMGGHIGSGFVVGGVEYGATYGIGGAWYGAACAPPLVTLGICMVHFVLKNRYLSLDDYLNNRYFSGPLRIAPSISGQCKDDEVRLSTIPVLGGLHDPDGHH